MTAAHTDSSWRTRRMGVRAASQSLKSPTSDTVVARGATTTKANSRPLAAVEREERSGRPSTTATNTAAIASAPNGESRMVRGRVSQPQAAWAAPAARRGGRRLTCSITRASRPASTVTGRRSWRSTRPISSSSGSNTFRLSENGLQLLARALHAHLERGFVAHEDTPALRRPGARRAAPIHQNAVQPCAESRRVVTTLERAIRPDERVLERLLGVFAIAEHVHGVAGPAVTVARDERGICLGVAAEHPAHRFHVARPHAMYTHARSPGVTPASPQAAALVTRHFAAEVSLTKATCKSAATELVQCRLVLHSPDAWCSRSPWPGAMRTTPPPPPWRR